AGAERRAVVDRDGTTIQAQRERTGRGELFADAGYRRQRAALAGDNALLQPRHRVAAQIGEYARWRVDAEFFLEPADGGLPSAADRAFHQAQAGADTADQPLQDHAAEIGEAAGQLDTEIAHHTGESAIEHAERA